MNKLVFSALAAALWSAPGHATESENEWLSLDQEIEALSSSLATSQGAGPNLGGWIIARYSNSSDIQADATLPSPMVVGGPPPTEDLGGFDLPSVRINIDGAVSDYQYKVSFELGDRYGINDMGFAALGNPTARLQDAYVKWNIAEGFYAKVGRFKQPFLHSALLSANRLLFLERTLLGSVFAGRQNGVLLGASWDIVRVMIAAQNGVDGIAKDLLITGRVEIDVMGTGVGKVEGAYGAGDGLNLLVGLAAADDGALDDGGHFALDATLTAGPFAAYVEVAQLDEGVAPLVVGTAAGEDASPFAGQVSWLFVDAWEAALRYEDSDNPDTDLNRFTVGLNRYVQGHDIKWQLNYSTSDADTGFDELEADVISLGVALTF